MAQKSRLHCVRGNSAFLSGGGGGGGAGLSEPPASRILLSRFPCRYLLPPALFRAAPVQDRLRVSLFCNVTACATSALMPLEIYDLRDVTTVNRFTISPEVSLFFSPSAKFRLLVCSEVSIVTEKTLNASQIQFLVDVLESILTHC